MIKPISTGLGETGDGIDFRKSRDFRLVCAFLGEPAEPMNAWLAMRTGLRVNSALTGKFDRKICDSAAWRSISRGRSAALQRFSSGFPQQFNREGFCETASFESATEIFCRRSNSLAHGIPIRPMPQRRLFRLPAVRRSATLSLGRALMTNGPNIG